jgi:hypothetical protein
VLCRVSSMFCLPGTSKESILYHVHETLILFRYPAVDVCHAFYMTTLLQSRSLEASWNNDPRSLEKLVDLLDTLTSGLFDAYLLMLSYGFFNPPVLATPFPSHQFHKPLIIPHRSAIPLFTVFLLISSCFLPKVLKP